MSFEELCRKLGGVVENDRIHEVLRCVVHTPFWIRSAEDNAEIIERMLRDAASRGIRAEVIIGEKLLGGWIEGLGIYVDPEDRGVSVWSRVFSNSIEPEYVAEVKEEIIEKNVKENGFEIHVEANVEQNPATDHLVGVAEASTSIPMEAVSSDVLKRAINAVTKVAKDYSDVALEDLTRPIEE